MFKIARFSIRIANKDSQMEPRQIASFVYAIKSYRAALYFKSLALQQESVFCKWLLTLYKLNV